MRRIVALIAASLVAAFALAAGSPKRTVPFDRTLPLLGTKFHSLPAGDGKDLVEAACYPCHSADLLVQQRLTEKQWTAAVEKMVRWGAKVDDAQKVRLIAYLAGHFGPESPTFRPLRTKPVGY